MGAARDGESGLWLALEGRGWESGGSSKGRQGTSKYASRRGADGVAGAGRCMAACPPTWMLCFRLRALVAHSWYLDLSWRYSGLSQSMTSNRLQGWGEGGVVWVVGPGYWGNVLLVIRNDPA